jgi:hypothetical protein
MESALLSHVLTHYQLPDIKPPNPVAINFKVSPVSKQSPAHEDS